jgi:hypothetical protein
MMLPTVVSGSENTYYCDAVWGGANWRVFQHGGIYSHGSQAGLFTTGCFGASSDKASDFGSRLIYIP